MPLYRFVAHAPEEFPTLGRVLEPDDQVTTDAPVDHPRLVLVQDKAPRKPTPAPEPAITAPDKEA